MRITSVSVRRLKTLGGYNNVAVEATAQVDDGEEASAVRNYLDLWVQAELDGKSVDQVRSELETLDWKVVQMHRVRTDLTAEIESLKQQIEKLRKTPLEQLAAGTADEMPF